VRRVLTLWWLLTLLMASGHPQGRGVGVSQRPKPRRLALVIGNAAYKDSPLSNPVNDAREMKQALTDLGFEVIYEENATQVEMKQAMRLFGERIGKDAVGLFYYAGHGMQVEGRNYLVPVGATINHENEVEYEAVDVGLLLAQMANAGNPLNIVILDACRNNPFARAFRLTKGDLASIDAPTGTLIAYATAPGSVASDGDQKNGLYTQELLKMIRIPGLRIEDVFKRVRSEIRVKTQGRQIPWESSALEGDFYFVEQGERQAETSEPPLNIAGSWKVTIRTLSKQEQTATLTLIQSGRILTGEMSLNSSEIPEKYRRAPLTQGVLEGKRLSFQARFELDLGDQLSLSAERLLLSFSGSVVDDRLTGTYSFIPQPSGKTVTDLPWSATRR